MLYADKGLFFPIFIAFMHFLSAFLMTTDGNAKLSGPCSDVEGLLRSCVLVQLWMKTRANRELSGNMGIDPKFRH